MSFCNHISRFSRCERGGVLVFWGVMLAVFLGLVAMSFDVGRVSITQSELQAYADNVALAAAGELDGAPGAITRATDAAEAIIADSQTFGNGGKTLSGSADYTLTFLSVLPADDSDPVTAVTTDPAKAVYVQVVVASQTVDLTFGKAFAFLTGQPPMNNVVSASAIAGFTSFACDVTPLMVCLPEDWSAADHVGTMIHMRAGGGPETAWGPGAFGFVDPSYVLTDPEGVCADEKGGNEDLCLLGAVGPITQCFSYRGVEIETGQKVGNYEAAINTRFDLYNSTMSDEKNDVRYAPAPNVIKGIVASNGGACIGGNEAISPDTIGLPRDDCFYDDSCAQVTSDSGPRYGDGTWDRDLYFSTNYPSDDPDAQAALAKLEEILLDMGTNRGSATRYEVYRAEIALVEDDSFNTILTGLAETGLPSCNTQFNNEVDHTRRVVIAAGIDCTDLSSLKNNLPVEEYIKVFLTEPASNDGTGTSFAIWGEIIDVVEGDGSGATQDVGLFREVVQLYR